MPTNRRPSTTLPEPEEDFDNVAEMVDFDLDATARPEKDVIRPFRVKVAGRVLLMNDPAELNWLDLANLSDPVSVMLDCLDPWDRAHLLDQDLPAWKIGPLAESFLQHYRMEEKLREARRREAALKR